MTAFEKKAAYSRRSFLRTGALAGVRRRGLSWRLRPFWPKRRW